MTDVVLETRGLWVDRARVPVLRGVNLHVRSGEAVGILGPNGAGKTTLLRALAGLSPVREGVVILDGNDVTGLPAYRRSRLGVGHVPQVGGVFLDLTVEENLRMGPAAHGQDARRIEHALQDYPQLTPLLGRKGKELSGGERRLLALAGTLAHDPSVTLLDEFSEGVQPSTVEETLELLVCRKRERGMAMVVVEQNAVFAARLCDRVFFLQRGEVAAEMAGGNDLDLASVEAFMGFGKEEMVARE